MSWARRRQAAYLGSTMVALLVVLGVPLFLYVYDAPSCFDGKQNGGELGVDCGGSCERLCSFQVSEPVVRWSRAFEVTPSNYSAVAYVENPNPKAAVESVPYTFQLFDEDGLLIAELNDITTLLPNRITPVFISGIDTGNRIPTQTFFTFAGEFEWMRAEDLGGGLVVTERVLSRPESAPRLDATLENIATSEFRDIEVVATIFGTDGNAVAASKTFIEFLPKQSSEHLVFTWPQPFPKRIESCKTPVDVMLLLDVSGSMNDDSDDPPQPITNAKEAAAAFVNRLEMEDRSGAVSFATDAKNISPLTISHPNTHGAVLDVAISSEEESGVTNIGAGLALADSELGSARHNPDARKVMILLTDGRANAPEEPGGEEFALTAASAAKEHDVTFYTIGLGEQVNGEFLRDVAGSEPRVFLAATSDDLDGIYRNISADICERGAAIIDILPKTRDAFRFEAGG